MGTAAKFCTCKCQTQEENEIYKIGKLYYDEPNKISVLGQGSYTQWNNYKFDLWEGVSIVKDESYEVYVFEPNKIQCIIE